MNSNSVSAEESAQAPLIVIGTGLAGYNLVKEFRKQSPDYPVVMLTRDDGRHYSKPMLSTGFTKQKTADQLAMASAEAMAQQLNVSILTDTTVTAIDSTQKQVILDNGQTLFYRHLVLACGARVMRPPISGNGLDQVYSVNDLQDYARLRQVLQGKQSVAIIGGGLIGCEFANDLINGGFQVQVIEPLGRPLPTLLPEAASQAVETGLEAAGVVFHYGRYVHTVEQAENGVELHLSDEDASDMQTVSADLVISAVGLRPDLALAKAAGLETGKGIKVDRFLRTSQPDVFALGDCAEVEGHVMLYVLPLMAGTRALAKTLCGSETAVAYGAMPVTIKTPACPVVVAPIPEGVEGRWEQEVDGLNVSAQFKDTKGVLRGFALTGERIKEKNTLAKQLPPLLS